MYVCVKKNETKKNVVSDIKLELSSATRMNVAGGRPAGGRGGVMMMHQTTQLGILQVLQDNGIDASKYKVSPSLMPALSFCCIITYLTSHRLRLRKYS